MAGEKVTVVQADIDAARRLAPLADASSPLAQEFARYRQQVTAEMVERPEGLKALCPDDHCNRRSPCEGRAAAHCHYSAGETNRNAALDEAMASLGGEDGHD